MKGKSYVASELLPKEQMLSICQTFLYKYFNYYVMHRIQMIA